MEIWLVVLQAVVYFFTLVSPLYGSDPQKTCKEGSNNIQWSKKAILDTKYERYPGEWWIADCQVGNVDVEATLWQNLSSTYKNRTVDRIKLIRENNVFNLTNISFSDAGAYYCEVCGTRKRVGGFRVITEGKAFQYPKITNKPNGSMEFGADLKLSCEVSGKYDLFWSKDGQWKSSNIEYMDANKGTEYYKKKCELTVRNFSKQDDGVYSCHASREIVNWHVQDEVHLKMKDFVKPAFLNISNNVIHLNEGETFYLSLLASGYPQPVVKCWQENKRKNNIIPNGTLDHLHISRVLYSLHNGTKFKCTATNLNGSSTRTFSLNICVKPKINIHEPVRNKTISMDTTPLDLLCQVDEANPLATVQWTYSNDNKQTWSVITPSFKFADVVGNSLQLKEQEFYRMFYKCMANNRLGEDVFTWKVLNEAAQIASRNKRSPSTFSYLIVIIVISSIVAVLLLCSVFVLYKRKKVLGGFYICTLPPDRYDYIEILDHTKFIHEQTHKLPYLSEWEFPRDNILLREELGSGAFGRVYLADAVGMESFLTRRNSLKDKSRQRRFSFSRLRKENDSLSNNDYDVVKTAVKTLKDDFSRNDLADILSELKVLIHVGEHENILRILGACTKVGKNEAPLIILEYCRQGNLRDYLRAKRDIYEPQWEKVDNVHLSVTDIATFALHVAKGMEFLISRKCIHRDLAARNVLISDGYVAKICDFGLARNVYENLEYVKLTTGLLPVKWMAIEAIQDRIFNEKTDVWSYGIVLWEMFTLGGTPYPDLEHSLLLPTLMDGKRMNPPVYCPEQISDVMLSCWYKDPQQRPSFSDIVCILQKLCEQYADTVHEDLRYQNVP